MAGGFLRTHPLLARVLLYGGALFLGLPAAFCRVQTHPVRVPITSPQPPYRRLDVMSERLRLRAWLAPGASERAAVLLVPGLGDTLESYLDIADVFRKRGHTVMLIDLRGQGGSEGSVTTLGARERADVRTALERLHAEQALPHKVVVMGWSMGAVAALRAAADREDIAAVIAESPYDTYRNTVARHAWVMFRIPHWTPMLPISVAFAEWWGHFDADEVDAVAAAAHLRAPLLLIADGADQRMPPEVVARVLAAHPGPKDLWVAPGMEHVSARLHPEYWPRVTSFLDRETRTEWPSAGGR